MMEVQPTQGFFSISASYRIASVSDVDTYVKVVLSIGTKQMKCKKTHVVKNNLTNPLYKESFTFNLTPDRLDQACVCIQVVQSKSKLCQVSIDPSP